jgi:flagellar biogenesis protein FliO
MELRSIPSSRTSPFELLRALFGRVSSFSRGRVWRRRPRRLRICETLSLGNRGYLAVVSYGRREFLLGGTTNSIALLAQLSAAPAAERELAEQDVPAR